VLQHLKTGWSHLERCTSCFAANPRPASLQPQAHHAHHGQPDDVDRDLCGETRAIDAEQETPEQRADAADGEYFERAPAAGFERSEKMSARKCAQPWGAEQRIGERQDVENTDRGKLRLVGRHHVERPQDRQVPVRPRGDSKKAKLR
jgi:hypothetical protein